MVPNRGPLACTYRFFYSPPPVGRVPCRSFVFILPHYSPARMFPSASLPGRRPPRVIAGTRFRYPHMLPADQLLWDVFLPKYGSYWDGFDYDIHVGEGVGPLPGYPPGIARAALSLTQKRIDAVGYRGSEVWVFEIKPHAGLSAIGQVLSYSELYDTAHPGGLVTHKAIVTDLTDADIHTLCRTWAIRLYSLGNVA